MGHGTAYAENYSVCRNKNDRMKRIKGSKPNLLHAKENKKKLIYRKIERDITMHTPEFLTSTNPTQKQIN